jgi:hypothetical protein
MTTWISSAEAFRHVLSQEADPGIARKRIISEIASERLPVKTATGFLPYDQVAECLEYPDLNWLEIDFQAGTASAVFASATPLLEAHRADWSSLQFSRDHLLTIWPTAGRPVGTGKQTTDALLVERMHALIVAGKANSRTDAASQILREDGVSHGASPEATVRRLRDRYTEHYGE